MATTGPGISAGCSNSISGALLELAALSNVDVISYCNAKNSFWMQSYKRVTNYAIAEHDLAPNNPPQGNWSSQSCLKVEVPAAGDLVESFIWSAELGALPEPTFAVSPNLEFQIWTPAVGFAMLPRAALKIGQQTIEELTSEYMVMMDELHCESDKRAGMAVGDYGRYLRGCANTGDASHRADEDVLRAGLEYSTRQQEIYAHLPFHMGGKGLNLVGMQQHGVEVELDIRSRDDCIVKGTANRATGAITFDNVPANVAGVAGGNMSNAKLRAIFVHLDTAERAYRAAMPSTIFFIYPQKQEISVAATDFSQVKEVRNHHNHPVVDWMWGFRSDSATANKQYFQFGAPRARSHLTGAHRAVQEQFDAINRVEVELNSHTRVNTRTSYLRNYMSAKRSKRAPGRVIHQYALAYDPTDDSGPKGSLNLSRVDNVVIRFHFRELASNDGTTGETQDHERIGVNHASSLVAQPDNTGLSEKGKIFWYARTINYAKQQGGQFGKLFAS